MAPGDPEVRLGGQDGRHGCVQLGCVRERCLLGGVLLRRERVQFRSPIGIDCDQQSAVPAGGQLPSDETIPRVKMRLSIF